MNGNVTTAEEDAQSYDTRAKNVLYYNIVGQDIPKDVQIVIAGENIPHIDEKAFESCVHLEVVDMSKSILLQSIAKEAFQGCIALVLCLFCLLTRFQALHGVPIVWQSRFQP